MNVTINEKDASRVAVISSAETALTDAQGAMDIIATAMEYDCTKIIVSKAAVSEDFFELKSGLAGEVLQKFTNYRIKFAIVGDFSAYDSKSLKDFIYESNKGGHVLFVPTEQAALDRLHSVTG